jgi:hypothetical protein
MAELVAAGAPELPEGWFYRVRPFLRTGIQVEVRHRRWIGSTEVGTALDWPRSSETGQALVVRMCREAFRDAGLRGHDASRLRDAREFIGDHDPRGGR